VIPVSATNSSDVLTSFSSWGSYVSLSAPGEGIYTTSGSAGYTTAWGTSFAAPVAAGVAALVMSAKSGLSNSQVESIVISTAADLGATGRDPHYGHGRVDAARAVTAALGSSATPADTQAPNVAISSPLGGVTVSGTVAVDLSVSDNVGVSKVTLLVNGASFATDTGSPFAFSVDSARYANGSITLQAVASDAAGNAATSPPVTLTVANATATPTPTPIGDTVPPTVAIIEPAAGSAIDAAKTAVKVEGSDNSGVIGMTMSLYINGGLQATAKDSQTLRFNWNTRRLPSGSYTLRVDARDAAGNISSTSRTVYK
jgi:hypothetical protein